MTEQRWTCSVLYTRRQKMWWKKFRIIGSKDLTGQGQNGNRKIELMKCTIQWREISNDSVKFNGE